MSSRHRRSAGKRFGRFLGWAAGAVLVGFVALQIVLATPWARQRVAGACAARIGLDVEIGGLGWTPWSGASIRDLVVRQPEALRGATEVPLLAVERIRAMPDYGAALRGEWRAREIVVERPEAWVTVEMLMALAGTAEAPPALAARTPGGREESSGAAVAGTEEDAPRIQRDAETSDDGTQGRTGDSIIRSAKRKPVRVRVSEGAFVLVHAGGFGSLIGAEKIDLECPLFQKAGEGFLEIGEWCLGDESLETGVRLDLQTTPDRVRFAYSENPRENLQVAVKSEIRFTQRVRIRANVSISLDGVPGGFNQSPANVSMDRLNLDAGFAGWLRHPATWRGALRFEGSRISLADSGVGFERFDGLVALDRGVFHVPRMRFLGDRIGLLGNGWMNRETGVAVVRLTAEHELIDRFSQMFGEVDPDRFGPDRRSYVDVELRRGGDGWQVGWGDSVIPADVFLERFHTAAAGMR